MREIIIKEVKGKWILKVKLDGKSIERTENTLMEITIVLFEMVNDLKKQTYEREYTMKKQKKNYLNLKY